MSLYISENLIFPLRLFDLQRPGSICGGDYQDGATELLLPVACMGLLLILWHLMCTLGRPVRRTANETMPNIVSVLTFCNQATALLQQQQKRVQRSSSNNNNTSTGEAGDMGESRETVELHQQELEEKQQWELGKKQQPELKEKQQRELKDV
ncbi:hypothetical protein CFC21_003391 [Triticum aestivum]|uniref:Uncharacterized protein n=1 Tax=Triticum aestivum TaxID=4565 RepID=A0A3B5Y4I0_WHEAT|nr:hypothetical protein CFC21_003391 [Triticum aestivum]